MINSPGGSGGPTAPTTHCTAASQTMNGLLDKERELMKLNAELDEKNKKLSDSPKKKVSAGLRGGRRGGGSRPASSCRETRETREEEKFVWAPITSQEQNHYIWAPISQEDLFENIEIKVKLHGSKFRLLGFLAPWPDWNKYRSVQELRSSSKLFGYF